MLREKLRYYAEIKNIMWTKIFLKQLPNVWGRNLNRTKRPRDISDYKKQQNLVVRLNKERRIECFENLETSKNSKPFWNKCKPNFFNKHALGESKIILIEKENVIRNSYEVAENVENEKLIVKNDEITKIFYNYFS